MSRRMYGVLFLSGLVIGGCEQSSREQTPGSVTSEDVRRDVGKAAQTAADFSLQAKEDFQRSLEARLEELDAEIAKLREKGGNLKDQAAATFKMKMAELETKRDAARAKLAEVGQSSAEAWKDVRKGAESAWDELDKAFREAASEF